MKYIAFSMGLGMTTIDNAEKHFVAFSGFDLRPSTPSNIDFAKFIHLNHVEESSCTWYLYYSVVNYPLFP